MHTATPIAFLAGMVVSGSVLAHGGHMGGHAFGASADPYAVSFGRPGDPRKVSRVVAVRMDDRECRLQPEVRIRQGDTVRFDVSNAGTRMHEFVIGTSHELKEHASQSANNPDADHEQPFIVHVDPGTREALAWRFTRVDLLSYGCLLHGSGLTSMSGRILVQR